MERFHLKELAGLASIMLALGGLVWTAAQQSGRIDDQGTRLNTIEQSQRIDHDSIVRVETGVGYLVERARMRDAKGEP